MRTLLWLTLILLLAPAHAEPPSIRDYARHAEFATVKLSPDGSYLAATVLQENETNLAVIRISDMKITGGLRGGSGRHVHDFWWVGPERVVAVFAERDGSLDTPFLTGEMVGMNADGTATQYLYGYRGSASGGHRIKQGTQEYGFARMVAPLPDDPKHAIISSDSFWEIGDSSQVSSVHRIDVYSGKTSLLGRAPLEGWTSFLADDEGKLRFAVGTNKRTLAVESYARNSEGDGWRKLSIGGSDAWIVPLFVDSQKANAYFSVALRGGRMCLIRQALTSEQHEQLACDAVEDLDAVVQSADKTTVIAAVYNSLKPKVDWLAPDHPDALLLQSLAKNFPDRLVRPVSWSCDGKKLLFYVVSDRSPGEYYLMDRESKKARYLVGRREWIDPQLMAAREPVTYKSRDGSTDLYGQLTLPRGVSAEELPAVVLIHGGPFGIDDNWFWDAEAQLLASRGFLVFQPNYRGSSGFGVDYQESARKAFGTTMIDDITDGTRALIAEGLADPNRICVMGGSYGGYASVMSAVREPDLYKCAIGYAGVYDLVALKKESDISESELGRNYIRMYVGGDEAELRQHSPITYIDRLKAPVLIVHGKRDQRTPFSQAKILRKALEQRGKPFEWLEKPNEGHGFVNVDNRVELYEKVLEFLKKNIGSASISAPGAEQG